MTIILFLLLAFNFFISCMNASVVGSNWRAARDLGGWPFFLTCCAGIMAAAGLTWVYLTVVVTIASSLHWLPMAYAKGAMEIGYLIVIFPILGSGLPIWLQSLSNAWRERSFGSVGVATWNTFAMLSNISDAVRMVPSAIGDLSSLFKSDDINQNAAVLMVALVAATLGAGVLTTILIAKSSMQA